MSAVRIAAMAAMVSAVAACAAPYTDLVPGYDRVKAPAMVRSVEVPTLANLDYAAYNANPVRHDPQKFSPKVSSKPGLAAMVFNGVIVGAVDDIAQTPLSAEEKARPLSWRALENRLWDLTKEQGFQDLASRVASEKFGDRTVFKPFQEIAAAYVHQGANGSELWVRIDFMPWVKFVDGVTDNDGDGFIEIYGRLALEKLAAEKVQAAFKWIAEDYCVRTLNRQEVRDWINVLASYWYPTMNTDVLDLSNETQWPFASTEKAAKKAMKGVVAKDPVAVVRGNPFGKPVYNVYVVPGLSDAAPAPVAVAQVVAPAKQMDTAVSANFRENMARFDKELKEQGGSYEAWAKKNTKWIDALKGIVAALAQGQMGVAGKGDWIYFRKSFDYMVGGDLGKQAKDKNAIPHLVDLKKYLADRNTNLIFVVVPNKEDIYYQHLPASMPDASTVMLNPYGRKILREVQEAGIEVIDLLPHLLSAKAQDGSSKESLYQHQDTHWTNRGLQIAANLIAERIKQFAWYKDTQAQQVAYTVRDTTFSRLGDIVDKMPETDRTKYPAVTLEAQRVYTPEGNPTEPNNKTAPILLMGDSFTGVFELVDCKSAGVGSHIAAKTGLPVDIITSWGGGPLVRQKALRARMNDMASKRVVVYLMVARDLYDYAQSWAPLEAGQ